MSHAFVQQGEPDPAANWTDFPCLRIAEVLYRICRSSFGAGWFSSDGGGRFDLGAPRGTCYLSRDWAAATLEVVGGELRGGVVCDEFFLDRRIAFVGVDDCRVADTTQATAASYGVTSQLGTMTPYAVPQAWAHFFEKLGWQGILYRLRFDPSSPPVGVALFGDAGAQDLDILRYESFTVRHFEILEQSYGIKVVSRPAFDELTII